jgi:hypothetical protein
MFKEYFEIDARAFKFVRGLPEKDGKDIARPLNGGLPPMPADAIGLFYPKGGPKAAVPKPRSALVTERAKKQAPKKP